MRFLKILKYGLENTKSDVFDTSRIVKNPWLITHQPPQKHIQEEKERYQSSILLVYKESAGKKENRIWQTSQWQFGRRCDWNWWRTNEANSTTSCYSQSKMDNGKDCVLDESFVLLMTFGAPFANELKLSNHGFVDVPVGDFKMSRLHEIQCFVFRGTKCSLHTKRMQRPVCIKILGVGCSFSWIGRICFQNWQFWRRNLKRSCWMH